MTNRAEQRDETRNRIVDAAVVAFAEKGFGAASTRAIATRAGVNQGLITYHFRSKLDLWKAAADRIFGGLRESFERSRVGDEGADARERAREAIRQYVRFVAAHPELFRLMVEEGKVSDARMKWLVDTHLKPLYTGFERLVTTFAPSIDGDLVPMAWYALAGASSLMFAVLPEARRLTGINPADKRVIETHAEFVARLFVP